MELLPGNEIPAPGSWSEKNPIGDPWRMEAWMEAEPVRRRSAFISNGWRMLEKRELGLRPGKLIRITSKHSVYIYTTKDRPRR